MSLPVTVATNEREFSKLKFIKSRVRSIMADDRLQALLLCSIEIDVIDALTDEELFTKMDEEQKRMSHLNCLLLTFLFPLFLFYFM